MLTRDEFDATLAETNAFVSEFLKTPATQLSAETGLLVSTPRSLDESRLAAVLPDDAAAEL